MPGPLSHIRVLDLSRVLAGPWASQNLADLGAEVIKIEQPGVGDDTRGYGPPFMKHKDGGDTRESAYFISSNRNKKSVSVDIKTPAGQEIVRTLAAKSQVFIENYKVGVLKTLGLSYADIKEINPSIIYCSITGYGQNGPLAERAGYDLVFQGMGGLMSITGERDDAPGGGPQKVGIAVTDVLTGMYASLAISAAITHRERTGQGQYIDLALLDTIVAFGANQIVSWFCSGNIPRRWGNAHAQITPYGAFETSDGHMILAIGNDGQFARFCKAVGRADLASDPRFKENAQRVRNRDALVTIVTDLMRTRTRAEWNAVLTAANVPCGPINNIKEVFDEPQVQARGLRVDMEHLAGGIASVVASPMRMSATPVEYRLPPPILGQHNIEVLGGLLGYSDIDIESLKKAGVI